MKSKRRIVIEPGGQAVNYWKDAWSYRGLFYFLAWRDILVRYKQTVIGVAWSVIRPLFYIIAFSFFRWLFGSQDLTSVILSVAVAILPWQFFSSAFTEIGNSLVANSGLMTKVYFPRLLVPVSSLIVCLIDFFISLVIVFVIMIWQGHFPDLKILLLPVFLLLAVVTSLGTGLLIASLNVKYRDFRYILTFVVQVGMFVSPIAFNSYTFIYENENIPVWVKYLYSLNPMVSVIDGFKWCFLGNAEPVHIAGFVISSFVSFIFLIAGIAYFRKTEKTFADII